MKSLMLKDFDRFIEKSFGMVNGNSYNEGFPYFDIREQTGNKEQKRFIIDVAVAGYTTDKLKVYIEANSLCIEGNKTTEINDEKKYLYRGITNKTFTRKILVPNEAYVESAELKNGILTIIVCIDKKKDMVKITEVTNG